MYVFFHIDVRISLEVIHVLTGYQGGTAGLLLLYLAIVTACKSHDMPWRP